MKATIFCEDCQGNELAVTRTIEAPLKELGPILSALLVAWHATPPHCPHKMAISFEVPLEGRELTVRCLKPGCENAPIETTTRVPIELVSAIVIAHHAAHEAHPLEFSYDGRTWRSP